MPIVYTIPNSVNLAIVYPSPGHDGWKDVPVNAINPRSIEIEDIHNSNAEFADGWVDVTPTPTLDICHQKLKDSRLKLMRIQQQSVLEHLGKLAVQALLNNDQAKLQQLQMQSKDIQNAHQALEALEVTGYNDPVVMEKIRQLATLPAIGG